MPDYDICSTCGQARIEIVRYECECNDMEAEIDHLRARLEVREDGGPDGIECRDETIRMQDQEIDRLRAEVEALRKAIDRIKVRAYELGAEEIHDMALAALRGEGEK